MRLNTSGLLLILPLSVALILALIYSDFSERQKLTAQQMQSENQAAEQLIHAYLSSIYSDIQLISNQEEILRFARMPNETNRQELEQSFLSTMQSRPDFMQIRVLDTSGMEKVRIDRNAQNKIFAIKAEHLQNKADRYYFKEALKLSANGIFQSPLDLNIENGKIEQPFKPTLRFVRPISTPEIKGYLIINLHANHFLSKISALANQQDNKLYLINSKGFYLNHPDNKLNWGFMLNRPELNIQTTAPRVWQQLTYQGQNDVRTSDGQLILGNAICINKSCYNNQLNFDIQTFEDGRHWYIINQTTAPNWWQLKPSTWLALALVLLISLLSLRYYFYLKQTLTSETRQKRELEEKLQQFHTLVENLPVAACLINQHGELLGCNPLAAEIFDLSPNKLRKSNLQKLMPDASYQALSLKIQDTIADSKSAILFSKQQPLLLQNQHKQPRYLSLMLTPVSLDNEFLLLIENVTLDIYNQKQQTLRTSLKAISKLSQELLQLAQNHPEELIDKLQMCAGQVELNKDSFALRPLIEEWVQSLTPETRNKIDIELLLTEQSELSLDQNNFNTFMSALIHSMDNFSRLTLQTKQIEIEHTGQQINLTELVPGDYMQISIKGENYKQNTTPSSKHSLSMIDNCTILPGEYLALGSAFGLVKQCQGSMRIECSEESRTIFIHFPIAYIYTDK